MKRPVRWIYGGNVAAYEDGDYSDQCAVRFEGIVCNEAEGVTGFELVNGEIDLAFADKAQSTVCRVVGDMSVRAGWFLSNGDDGATLKTVPPVVRFGICVIDGVVPSVALLSPPDLWLSDPSEDVRWLWRKQVDLGMDSVVYPNDSNDHFIENTREFHVDVRVNAKMGREASLVLCIQSGYYNPLDVTVPEVNIPQVVVIQDLRVLVKN